MGLHVTLLEPKISFGLRWLTLRFTVPHYLLTGTMAIKLKDYLTSKEIHHTGTLQVNRVELTMDTPRCVSCTVLLKPVTSENVAYVENRWSALTATLESAGSTVLKMTMDSSVLITIANGCRPYIVPSKVVEHLIKRDHAYAELYNQISTVYSYSGMKLVEEMKLFSTKPYTCAILLASVMEQARTYLVKYNQIKSSLMLRILNMPECS
ncbi:hypothetical protein ElyMa_005716500 [Elysia marginata]|uniref:Uncharacterized protein n=1 Tax=Elysia marginata TaxID=1093978 RepID=A0AAV4FIS4_9GAST|nr:hypothetical protein ElyMa_005716500 [Elysia marginata]